MTKQIILVILILAVSTLAIWYGTKEVNAPSFDPEVSLEATGWSWQYTDLLNGERVEAPVGDRFILTFDGDGNLGSTTDCNSMGGSYVIDGEVLSIGELVMTKMYCEGSVEGVYAEQLRLVNSYVIVDDTLKLNLNRDYGVMVFKKQ